MPPIVGPMLTPSATRIALVPSARPRSDAGKARVIIATLTEKMAAPPTPWKQRAAMSAPSEGAAPQSAEPTVKTAKPARKSGLRGRALAGRAHRSEEHTSELQSQSNLVCRLLLEKKKKR